MKRLMWILPFLLALPVLAQPRGGPSATATTNVIIPTCVVTSGACPANGYVCVSGYIVHQCMVSTGWKTLSIGGASNTPTNGQCATWDATTSRVSWEDCATIGVGTGDALTTDPLSQFADTTSAELAGVLSNETGTGLAVFATSPVLTTPNIGTATGSVSGSAASFTGNLDGDVSGLQGSTVVADDSH